MNILFSNASCGSYSLYYLLDFNENIGCYKVSYNFLISKYVNGNLFPLKIREFIFIIYFFLNIITEAFIYCNWENIDIWCYEILKFMKRKAKIVIDCLGSTIMFNLI